MAHLSHFHSQLISIARQVEASQPRDLTEVSGQLLLSSSLTSCQILIFSTSALSRLVDLQVPYLETPSGVVARVPGTSLNVKV
eukprot:752560-Hanusia_phi.AAC.2